MGHRSEALDAVRGMAIALVVACHAFPGMEDAAFGVDLFFVLSGYLIGGILLDHRDSGRFFTTFYARRACRILPLYWALLLLVSLDLPAWQFLVFAQTLPWAEGAFPSGQPISVTWSLAVEEQFYLLLPALVWVLPRRWLIAVLWGCVVAAPLWRHAVWGLAPAASFLLLPCRLDALMGGTLIACFLRISPGSRGTWTYRRCAIIWGLAAVVAPAADLGLKWLDRGYQPVPLSVVAFIFAATVFVIARQPSVRLTALRPLAWLGLGAYSIYLFHMPLLRLMGGWPMGLPAVALLAWISWVAIEAPLIKLARQRWRYMPRLQPVPATPTARLAGLPRPQVRP